MSSGDARGWLGWHIWKRSESEGILLDSLLCEHFILIQVTVKRGYDIDPLVPVLSQKEYESHVRPGSLFVKAIAGRREKPSALKSFLEAEVVSPDFNDVEGIEGS
jgi:hypothetical protein